jgi:hypothetical protein
MSKSKLSKTMLLAVEAIRAAGGEAHPEKGGWWRNAPAPAGERIGVPSRLDPGRNDTIGTLTIHALADRGLLEPMEGRGNRIHSAYRLTQAASSITCVQE